MTNYISTYNYKLHGIPCQVAVKFYEPAEDDVDYCAGFAAQFDWDLLDRKGYRAAWLEKKATPEDNDEIRMFLQEKVQ